MPLQKPPPNSAYSADDPILTRRQLLQVRRRTLQTVKELTSEDPTPNTTTPNDLDVTDSNVQKFQENGIPKTSRGNRRRSLPLQSVEFGQGLRTQPSILVTAADITSPFDWGRRDPQFPNAQAESSGTKTSNRLSADTVSRNNHLPQRQPSILKGTKAFPPT